MSSVQAVLSIRNENKRISGYTVRAAADNAGQARCHAGGGLGDFPGEQDQRLFLRVSHGQS